MWQPLKENTSQILMKPINRYYLFVFLKDLSFFGGVLIPFFTDWGGISLFQVQFLQSWFAFWLFILEVPTGIVADLVGRKRSLAIGAIVLAIAQLIYGSIPDFKIFLLAEFCFACGLAFISGADEALIYDVLKEQQQEDQAKKVLGKTQAVHLWALLIGAPIGSVLAKNFGLNMPMLLSAVPTLAAVLVCGSLQEAKVQSQESEASRYWQIFKDGVRYIFAHPQLKSLTFNAILVASAAYFVIWFYQPLLQTIGVPLIYFGFIHAAVLLVEILISSNFQRFERLLAPIMAYEQATALVVALAFILVALIPNLVTIVIFIVLAAGFGLTRLSYMTAKMQIHIPSARRATILSSISMLRRLSLVILNPVLGWVASRSLSQALFLIGILPLLVFIPHLAGKIRIKQQSKNYRPLNLANK